MLFVNFRWFNLSVGLCCNWRWENLLVLHSNSCSPELQLLLLSLRRTKGVRSMENKFQPSEHRQVCPCHVLLIPSLPPSIDDPSSSQALTWFCCSYGNGRRGRCHRRALAAGGRKMWEAFKFSCNSELQATKVDLAVHWRRVSCSCLTFELRKLNGEQQS